MSRESPTVPPNNPVFKFNRETYSIEIGNIAEQGTHPFRNYHVGPVVAF